MRPYSPPHLNLACGPAGRRSEASAEGGPGQQRKACLGFLSHVGFVSLRLAEVMMPSGQGIARMVGASLLRCFE